MLLRVDKAASAAMTVGKKAHHKMQLALAPRISSGTLP
jgi:hypothetical protein